MAQLHSTWLLYITLYHMALHYSTMALLHSTSLCISLPLFYFSLLHSTMALFHTIRLGVTTILLYSTLLYHSSASFYLTLHYSTLALLQSTWLYISLTLLYFFLLHSTLLYHAWLYFALLDSAYANTSLVPCVATVTFFTNVMCTGIGARGTGGLQPSKNFNRKLCPPPPWKLASTVLRLTRCEEHVHYSKSKEQFGRV